MNELDDLPAEKLQRPARGTELIRFSNLYKSFNDKQIYKDLSLSVLEGETLTIIGGSGMGKSVLLKCLIGLIEPDSGQIIFEGRDLTHYSEEEFLAVRLKVGMVFQGAALFDSLSVGENIAYPLREHTPEMPASEIEKTVSRTLKLVDLPDIESMRPSDLSGGMRKRVGLARAIATDPEVILWDEPTTGLDPVTTRNIDDLIKLMKERLGCTSMVVTHDMDSAFAVSDRIAMLANQTIIQVGTVDEMKNSKVTEVRQFFDARKQEAMSR